MSDDMEDRLRRMLPPDDEREWSRDGLSLGTVDAHAIAWALAEVARLQAIAEAARAHRCCHYEGSGFYVQTRTELWNALDTYDRATCTLSDADDREAERERMKRELDRLAGALRGCDDFDEWERLTRARGEMLRAISRLAKRGE